MKNSTFMSPLRKLGVLVAGVAAALTAAAQPSATDWSKVEAEARKEGRVVLYTASVGSAYIRTITQAFEKRYGISVSLMEARSAELRERIRSEQAAGRYAIDVMHNATSTTTLMHRAGLLQDHGGIPNQGQVQAPFKPTAAWVPSNAHSFGILVNTNLVKPQEEPRSWKDLLHPRWKGKMLADDFRAPGGGALFFMVMHDRYGVEFHQQLAQQNLQFSREFRLSPRRVARGEFPIYTPELIPFYADLKGLPIKLIIPEEGSPYMDFSVSMLKNAPNPNAARLLMNFFLEPESQLEIAHAALQPVVPGVLEKAPEHIRNLLAQVRYLGTTDVDRSDAMLELAKKIYK